MTVNFQIIRIMIITPEGIELASKSFVPIDDIENEMVYNQLRAMSLSATFNTSKTFNFGYLTRITIDLIPPLKIEFVEREVGKNSIIATCFYVDVQSRMEKEVRQALRDLCKLFISKYHSLPEIITDTTIYHDFVYELEKIKDELIRKSKEYHPRNIKDCVFKDIVYLRKNKLTGQYEQYYPKETKDIAEFSLGIANLATGKTAFEDLLKEQNIKPRDILRIKLDWHFYKCPECNAIYQKKQSKCDAADGLCMQELKRYDTSAIILLDENDFIMIYGITTKRGIKEPLVDVKLRALFSRLKLLDKDKIKEQIDKTRIEWKKFGLLVR